MILANVRTGSTALGYQLQQQYESLNVKYFPEPFGDPSDYTIDRSADIQQFVQAFNSNNPYYIVKFMPWQMQGIKEYQALYNGDCFKIKITRESEFNQIVSFYIGQMTGIFSQDNKLRDQYSVDINPYVIKKIIRFIKDNNTFLKYCSPTFDAECTYERLNLNDQSKTYKTTQPLNITEVEQAIKEIYESWT